MREKIKITQEHLKEKGSRVLFTGCLKDKEINFYGWGNPDRILKFVISKGFIDDWCIYIEDMNQEQTIYEVADYGNKIHDEEKIKAIVECSEEVFRRYRH